MYNSLLATAFFFTAVRVLIEFYIINQNTQLKHNTYAY
jgi:hypothetical protein